LPLLKTLFLPKRESITPAGIIYFSGFPTEFIPVKTGTGMTEGFTIVVCFYGNKAW